MVQKAPTERYGMAENGSGESTPDGTSFTCTGAAPNCSDAPASDEVITSTLSFAVGGGDQSGDRCETIPLSQGRIAVSIGDVCGHGEAAFETMTAMRDAVHEAAERGFDPMQTLASANVLLCEKAPDGLATAIFGIVDPSAETFTYANAGHPAPLIVGQDGPDFLDVSKAEFPLGVIPRLEPALHRVAVPSETLLVLYTDGVTEHERDTIEGEAQLREAAAAAYYAPDVPVASAIARRMRLAVPKHDDAAILTAWLPRSSTATNGRTKNDGRRHRSE